MGSTIMEAKYNDIFLFQHWRKMATCYSITPLSKYLFSQLGLIHEATYFKCWFTQVSVVTRLRDLTRRGNVLPPWHGHILFLLQSVQLPTQWVSKPFPRW